MPTDVVPNHHANHPGFSGFAGYVAGLTMILGRGPVARLAVAQTAITRGDHVVDVGCGPGAVARVAARQGAEVIAVDPAPVMLKMARWLTRRRLPIRWTEGAAEALPLEDGSASVVWSIATVHHWPDLRGGLAEARRVLRGRGRFLAIERRTGPGATGLASHGWTDEQAAAFADCCRDAGFIDVDVQTERPARRALLVVRATRP